jgi:FkbM family methyltransferase
VPNFDTLSPWGTWQPRGLTAICLSVIDHLPVTWLTRKLAFLLRKPVKNGSQACFDREIWGLKMRLSSRGNLTEQRWLTMPKFHDATEREALRAALRPSAVFLDVGANAGFYTFWALSQGYAGLRVISVEPNPVMLTRLRHNLTANTLNSLVTLFPCAATPTPCEVVIEEHAENLGQSTARFGGEGRKVPGRPLLDIILEAEVSAVDAMKIDIEGYETPVLEAFFASAPRTLWPRLIIVEIVSKDGEPLSRLLQRQGYKIIQHTKMNGILALTETLALDHGIHK